MTTSQHVINYNSYSLKRNFNNNKKLAQQIIKNFSQNSNKAHRDIKLKSYY